MTARVVEIPLSYPDLLESDIEAVVDVLRTPRLSLGPKLREFEESVASYVGAAHGVALSSGTAGLDLGLKALGIEEGDEVILPSFAFIAAANAVAYQRAIPVFADINPTTLNLDPQAVERALTPRTKAILAVHTFGYPADLDRLLKIAQEHRLYVIEDACEAIGAEYQGQKVGAFGEFGVFSFYPNKPITTGEGGVVVTNDERLAATVRALSNQGRRENDGWLEHSLLGYNCRISDINCALGLAQLKRIDGVLRKRQSVADLYTKALEGNSHLSTPPGTVENGRVCWFAYAVRLSSEFTQESRDRIINEMTSLGIGCRAYFPPIHLQPLYKRVAHAQQPLPVTESLAPRMIALPFFNQLTKEQILHVCETLARITEEILMEQSDRNPSLR